MELVECVELVELSRGVYLLLKLTGVMDMQCNFVKGEGKRCQAIALRDDEYCLFHTQNEEMIKIREQARQTGGKNGKIIRSVEQETFKINCLDDVIKLLEIAINQVLQENITTSRANCVAYIANTMISAFEKRDIERKIAILERVVVKE